MFSLLSKKISCEFGFLYERGMAGQVLLRPLGSGVLEGKFRPRSQDAAGSVLGGAIISYFQVAAFRLNLLA